jgi:hypothetical protein
VMSLTATTLPYQREAWSSEMAGVAGDEAGTPLCGVPSEWADGKVAGALAAGSGAAVVGAWIAAVGGRPDGPFTPRSAGIGE